ncbi:hypothetical protein [Burkholderia cenocepacia]|uniref:hypothetical protein n=1 Tax=Burkholderia cenocepacia TaxID=95486 RepID=UPI0007C68B37|nr:hypothetical protein [Burkholderia cenocepacia]
MDSKLHILQHALGVNDFGEGCQYRSHFVTSAGSNDYVMCRELVTEGLMTERPANALSGGCPIFLVTPAGVEFVAQNSPPRPKLSRAKQRYRDYLAADGCMGFREWLGIKPQRQPTAPRFVDMPDFD